MERDFLGLNLKEPLAVVKEEVNSDGFKDIGFSKGSGMHWPFSNKVSALRHLMSFKVAQDDKTAKRIASDSPVSPGFLSISTSDAFDSSHKQLPELQAYPVSNYPNSITMSHPFFKSHCATTAKPQLTGGFPVATPQTILPSVSLGSANRIMDPSVKASRPPAQLTIFYGGTVNVFDDISPEKAQAIMFLAGNSSSMSSNMAQPKNQLQAPSSKPVATDISPVNQQYLTTPPCSRLSSPLSVSSHTGAQSRSGSTSTEETVTVKSTGAATTPVSKRDTPNLTSSMSPVATATMLPSVPQARKASLARFLEKRKERGMSVAPYNLGKI